MSASQPSDSDGVGETEAIVMKLKINGTEVPVAWERNASVEDLVKALPLRINISEYGGFEQVGPIGRSIIRDGVRMTTECGDIVLYSGNQIVIFFGSNTWAYAKLGHIDLPQSAIEELPSGSDVVIELDAE